MLRIRPRQNHVRSYVRIIKQAWKYAIIMYLAFTCFYLYNNTLTTNQAKPTKPRRKQFKRAHEPTLAPLAPKEDDDPEDNNDFMRMFPDPDLNPNMQQMRRRGQQMRELQNSQLDKRRRLQIENELKLEDKKRNNKFIERIQLLEDVLPYNFTSSKTKHRVDVISKIRWRKFVEGSVEIHGFSERELPYDIAEHYSKLRDVINMDQTLEFTYKPFILTRPSFATDTDRMIFLKNSENEEAMRQRPDDQFQGFIDAYKDGVISDQIDCGYKNNRRSFVEFTADKKDLRLLGHVVCPLLVPNGHTFQHFLDGVLPKIIQAYDLIATSNVMLLIHQPRDPNILSLLDRLGIDRSRLIFHRKGLWKAKTVIDTCITPPLHPTLFRTARRAFGGHDNLTVPLSEAYVILLYREDALNEGRKIINRAELTGTLYNRYGSNLKLLRTTTSISDTVELFRNAKIIIGVHGGGLYNMMFAPSGTSIIEVMPMDRYGSICSTSGKLAHQIFWHLAAMSEQRYWRLIEEPKQGLCNIKMNMEKLQKVLDKIDERHHRQELGLL